jgi:hypothetical protein
MTTTEQDEAINQIREFLGITHKFHGREPPKGYRHTASSFLLAYGQPYYTDEKSFEGRRRTPKQCFMNAYQLTFEKDLTYVEGYCHMGIIPIEHAWCITREGIVVDPTLPTASGYFGVPFKSNYLLGATYKKGTYGLLGWENRGLYKLHPDSFLAP